MVLRACDAVVEKFALMFRTAGGGMRPEHDDVWKLTVLGALDRHGKVPALLSESQTRTIAHGLPHELGHLCGGEARLPLCPAQTIHAADRLRDGSVSGQRRQKHPQVGARSILRQDDI